LNDEESAARPVDDDDPVVVYRTKLLHEADMVAEAMSRAQIPHFRRVETIGGLSAAMPAAPPPGLLPGDFYAIVVPTRWATRASRFIAALPVPQEIRSTHRTPGVREMFQGRTWIFVLAVLLTLLLGLIRMYLL